MFRRETIPYNVRKKTGNVDECPRGETVVVRERQKPNTGSDACSQNCDASIAALEEPVCGASRVQYGLPDSRYGASNIRRNQVLSAFQLWRLTMVVIREAQPQSCDSRALKHTAELDLSIPLAVPQR